MPPIDVYRIGELHFVKDGHHRVSVARALGHEVIDAYVTEVSPSSGADRAIRLADLPLKSHQRLFFERVPLPAGGARREIKLSDEWRYAALAEAVEAWGFRAIQERGELLTPRRGRRDRGSTRSTSPVVEMLREAELIRRGDGDRGLHARVAPALPDPAHARMGRRGDRGGPAGARGARPWEDDTMVRALRKELR